MAVILHCAGLWLRGALLMQLLAGRRLLPVALTHVAAVCAPAWDMAGSLHQQPSPRMAVAQARCSQRLYAVQQERTAAGAATTQPLPGHASPVHRFLRLRLWFHQRKHLLPCRCRIDRAPQLHRLLCLAALRLLGGTECGLVCVCGVDTRWLWCRCGPHECCRCSPVQSCAVTPACLALSLSHTSTRCAAPSGRPRSKARAYARGPTDVCH